ncbi:hypothetical protein N7471_010639 [Penicillium samsonianum]|uniref:uncharacterized protein n=1 Tax=Penicillium samsonianum TaxID=1882272 RepID=UPI00254813F2|nr:uncharacterized protein N7471_010639 [Penicillium samsonianum]KAJ6126146.1 hypothetical protein N7471_010639 [Penicillium samsonianum]
MATCQSSTYGYAQSFSDQLVREAMFRANITLALARSSEPHNLLVSFPVLHSGSKFSELLTK